MKKLLITFVATLILWGIAAWPLPKYIGSGIPTSWHNTGKYEAQAMVPGDHLQFLYHLWLAKDTFFGPTPLFHNLYEFNMGDDEERLDNSMRYYLPFSLVSSLGAASGNQAFAWNFMDFVSLWCTFLFTWLLVQRYTKDKFIAITASALAVIFPYRWFTLMGGSPTGLAMMWVPLIYYGLDLMVNKKSTWGAATAGMAICFAQWCDPHVTFFTGLTAPFWCYFSYIYHNKGYFPKSKDILHILLASLPLILFGIVIILEIKAMQSGLDQTVLAKANRTMSEISIFCPRLSGAVSLKYNGVDSQIYTGIFLLLLLFSGTILSLINWIRNRKETQGDHFKIFLCVLLMNLAVLVVIFLSTGTRNCLGGVKSWAILIKILSPYGKIRQTAKIFLLMPTLIAICTAICLPAILHHLKTTRLKNLACLVILGILVIDFGRRISPPICLLDTNQDAYKAVITDAASDQNDKPIIMALPLWPGNSHWTSINQYYVSLYRLRMLNGYRPTPRTIYREYIQDFECFNKGKFPDAKLDDLMEHGIGYLILHEDAFPEKVSPFSVSHELYSMLAHPRLKLLKQDGPAWTFKIVDAPDGIYSPLPDWKYCFPARLWQAERSTLDNSFIKESNDCSGKKYANLPSSISVMSTDSYPLYYQQGLNYLIRLRGHGSYTENIYEDEKILRASKREDIDTDNWEWRSFTIPEYKGYANNQLSISPYSGSIDIDLVLLDGNGTNWNTSSFTDKITIPAPTFFHSGFTDIETGEVVLSPNREADDAIFYGPKLPVATGTYKISLDYKTDAPDGTLLGTLKPRYHTQEGGPVPVIAGAPACMIYQQKYNLRMALDFVFSRNAAIRIKSVIIEQADSKQ